MRTEAEATSQAPDVAPTADALASWRTTILEANLKTVAIAGLVSMVASSFVLVKDGQLALLAVYWALFATFVAVVVRRGLPYRWRLGLYQALALAFAVGIAVGEPSNRH